MGVPRILAQPLAGKEMQKRIHVFGASGSGTTTLGKRLSQYLNYSFFDSDNYFWLPTVFIVIPKDVRMSRLQEREKERYGNSNVETGGKYYQKTKEFISWASSYDDGATNVRSRALHEQWIKLLPCEVLRIEGIKSIKEEIELILDSVQMREIHAR